MFSSKGVHSRTRHTYNLAAKTYHELFHNEMNEKACERRLLDSFTGRFVRGALICDAGCGPSAHIGKYLADKGLIVIGVDISDRCVDMASALHPDMQFRREDIANLSFRGEVFDGVLAYYSIIHTPKTFIGRIFREFHRVLKPDGYLLVAVKARTDEGDIHEFLGIQVGIYSSFFHEREIEGYYTRTGFALGFLENFLPPRQGNATPPKR